MIFRNLDENGDWLFGKGKNDFLRDVSAIGMNIRTRIYSWLNDCFFDMPAGIDWNNRLGTKGQKALLDADLKRIILSSEGVTGLESFSSNVINRQYTADFSVFTTFSTSYKSKITLGA